MSRSSKRRLGHVGMAAMRAVMTDREIEADPAKAMNVAMAAMRAVVETQRSS